MRDIPRRGWERASFRIIVLKTRRYEHDNVLSGDCWWAPGDWIGGMVMTEENRPYICSFLFQNHFLHPNFEMFFNYPPLTNGEKHYSLINRSIRWYFSDAFPKSSFSSKIWIYPPIFICQHQASIPSSLWRFLFMRLAFGLLSTLSGNSSGLLWYSILTISYPPPDL